MNIQKQISILVLSLGMFAGAAHAELIMNPADDFAGKGTSDNRS